MWTDGDPNFQNAFHLAHQALLYLRRPRVLHEKGRENGALGMLVWPATLLMPGVEKADVLAAVLLMEDRGCVLLYKCEEQFLEMSRMFLDGDCEMV